MLARTGRKQLGDITVRAKHLVGVLQALDDFRGLRVELTVIKGQVHLADETITHPRIALIGQYQFGRQGKKR